MVRAALTAAAFNSGYLDNAAPAIAAAAIIASRMPGEALITSPYAPDFLLTGEVLQLDADMPQLAIEAPRACRQPLVRRAGPWPRRR